MYPDLAQLDLFKPSLQDIGLNLLVAFFCGLIIAMIYRITYRGTSYSPTFVNSLVLLCMITAIVILVIGNNLARAFGLVGAMSIIRFRTAVRDVQDIMFIFFSLTIGMAAGVNLPEIALPGTLLVGSVIMLLVFTGFGRKDGNRHLLKVIYVPGNKIDDRIKSILGSYGRRIKLINLKNIGDLVESTYQFKLRWFKKMEKLSEELSEIDEIRQSNLYNDDGFETD